MPEFKVNVGDPKTGKTVHFVLDEAHSKALYGKVLRAKISGSLIGYEGYEFEITGGSDSCGFPMRQDLQGAKRKKILLTGGVGFKPKRKGQRRRKAVAGNVVMPKTSQVNLKILKYGKKPLVETEAKPKEEATKKEAKVETKKEETPKEKEKPDTKTKPPEEKSKTEASKQQPKEEATKKEEPKKQEVKPEPKIEIPKEEPKTEAPEKEPKEEAKK